MSEDRPLRRKELAESLQVSPATVSRWRRMVHFPSHVIGGRRVYFLDEVIRWVRALPATRGKQCREDDG